MTLHTHVWHGLSGFRACHTTAHYHREDSIGRDRGRRRRNHRNRSHAGGQRDAQRQALSNGGACISLIGALGPLGSIPMVCAEPFRHLSRLVALRDALDETVCLGHFVQRLVRGTQTRCSRVTRGPGIRLHPALVCASGESRIFSSSGATGASLGAAVSWCFLVALMEMGKS